MLNHLPSNVTVMSDARPAAEKFVVTNEYQRFAEFCDACRRYRYIGLCYGTPGVGKTLSARHYADWDRIEAHLPVRDADTAALRALQDSQTVFYTPAAVHSPGQIARVVARRTALNPGRRTRTSPTAGVGRTAAPRTSV